MLGQDCNSTRIVTFPLFAARDTTHSQSSIEERNRFRMLPLHVFYNKFSTLIKGIYGQAY